MIAASVALMASFSAVAGLGGLNVQSHLGEPFSGTVTVTGEEAKILLSGGKASISDNRLSTSVRKSGDNAVVSIRSSGAVRDPVLVFQMGVGAQARQYTAIIDPPGYASGSAANRAPVRQADEPVARASERSSRAAAAPRAAQSRPAPAKAQERQSTRVAAGKYTVRSGETLMGIAGRVRPAGLSTRQTMLALVQANPEIFESGSPDRIWPGNVLNIPAAEELYRLAKPGEPVPAEPMPAPAASEPVAEPAPASAPVAAPVEASAPAAASGVLVQPASEPAAVPAPQPEPRESGSWWRWLLLGGLGLIALWMLSKMLGKKHKTVVFKEEDDTSPFDAQSSAAAEVLVEEASASEEGIRTHQPVARPSNNAPLTRAEAAATLAAGKAATEGKGKSESSGLEVEDDFDDDIFFTDVEKVAVKEADDSINLDLGSIDSQQNGILSGAVTRDEATEQRKEVDWERVESTESVYEPDEAALEAPLPTDTVSVADIAAKVYEPAAQVVPEAAKPASWAEVGAEGVEVADVDFASDEKEPVVEEDPFAPLEFDTEADDAKRIDQIAGVADEPATESWYAEAESAIAMQESDDVAVDAGGITLDEGAPATIEWDEAAAEAADERAETGFITESVGMTAPLEAKYELAKMYIEIGDPEAARDTLLELMEESDGGILAKAQALLDELDAS